MTFRPLSPPEQVAGTDQLQRAQAFASLHQRGAPLLLANAWDVGSAVANVEAGAAAVATTSAGMAWSLGLPDAGALGAQRAAAAVGRIAAAVSVPVSADIEAGYGPRPEDVAATVEAVVRAGAVGVNLEDRASGSELFEPDVQAQRLAAARGAAQRSGLPLWINARTDLYLVGLGPPEQRVELALKRAASYAAAGADSLFVPGLVDLEAISVLAAGPLPITIMVWDGAPVVSQLAAAGVVRISLGSAVAQAAYGLAARATTELLTSGTYATTADGVDYDAMNRALSPGCTS